MWSEPLHEKSSSISVSRSRLSSNSSYWIRRQRGFDNVRSIVRSWNSPEICFLEEAYIAPIHLTWSPDNIPPFYERERATLKFGTGRNATVDQIESEHTVVLLLMDGLAPYETV